MRKSLTLLVLLACLSVTAQTKWIAHKSHSGANASFFSDPGNRFSGPGMVPIDYIQSTLLSNIKLQSKAIFQSEYPTVQVQWETPSLLFFSDKDSLIGCDRDFREYLISGMMVYNKINEQVYLYDPRYNEQLIRVTDSIEKWNAQGQITEIITYIFTENYHRISCTYPFLSSEKVNAFFKTPPLIKEEQVPVENIIDINHQKNVTLTIEKDTISKEKNKPKHSIFKKNRKTVKQSSLHLNYKFLAVIGFVLTILYIISRIMPSKTLNQ